jgi:GDPmannose 4,6-dehydratase
MHKTLYLSKKIDTVDILNIDKASDILNNKKCIIVTGVTGQDGSHMIDYLLENAEDFILFGGVRRLSIYNHNNIKHIDNDRFFLINFDLTDSHTINSVFNKLKPSYFINFAAQSFVGSSWDFPEQTWNVNSTALIHILESIRLYCPTCKLYQAGSSEEFGNIEYSPQDEKHPLKPRSPYGASKVASRVLIKTWRESYNLFAIQGWLFNHEGIRRGEEFITRKITKTVAYIKYCIELNYNFDPLSVGNIYANRDWSDAKDFMDGVWKMLNNSEPKEYVLASGIIHSVKDCITTAFKYADIDGYWENSTSDVINEKFYINNNSKKILLVKIDPNLYRPAEVDSLLGNYELANKELNWYPKNNFENLIKEMVEYDYMELINYDRRR